MELKDATSGTLSMKKRYPGKFVDSCRVCMVPEPVMSSDIFEEKNSNILKQVLFCTGVTLLKEDGFPSKICSPCLNDLTVAYKFKTSCILADKTFRDAIVEPIIKIEDSEESDANFDEHEVYEDVVKEEDSWSPQVWNDPLESSAPTERPNRGRPKSATTPQRLRKHKLHCESCDIKFKNRRQFDKHKKTEHKDDENCEDANMPRPKLSKEERNERKRLAEHKRRQKLKSDPVLREEYRRKERERYVRKKAAGVIVPRSAMTLQTLRALRKKNLVSALAYYNKKRAILRKNTRPNVTYDVEYAETPKMEPAAPNDDMPTPITRRSLRLESSKSNDVAVTISELTL